MSKPTTTNTPDYDPIGTKIYNKVKNRLIGSDDDDKESFLD
jgi:hypothetical protein